MLSRQTPVSLCFQDRYILAFDRTDLPFNSYLIVEFNGRVDEEKAFSDNQLEPYIQ